MAEWKKQHGVEDFPGGITPQPFPATVYQFKPRAEQPPSLSDYCIIKTAWPQENIEAGDICYFCKSRGEIGQIILIRYRGHNLISRLTSRNKQGHITVVGSSGKPTYLRRAQYEIKGRLFSVQRDGQEVKVN
jgi:hypothetical protein